MIGKELGQYKILAEIGRGGMGIVYKAYQKSLNREIALKVLPAALTTDEGLVARFHREAESAARLCHPNIVQIFDINELDNIHFFAMEYLRGESLTQKIEREGPLRVKEAVRIVMAVADALNYSHSEGIVHRDIKPGNIMIDPQGHVKVTDFGLARVMESSRLTMTGTILGTPEYMSPEQARGEPLDGRSDIYSLGIVLYEALTSKIPFEATTPFAIAQKQIYEPLPLPRLHRPDIPDILEKIILKATAKLASERHKNGEELRSDLEAFATGTGFERITPTVAVSQRLSPSQAGRIKRIRWGRAVLAAAIVSIILAFAWKYLTARPREKIETVKMPLEKPKEEMTVSLPAPETSIDAEKMLNEARNLIDQGFYSKALSKLKEIQEKFPAHTQTSLIPQWIEEIKNKEAGNKFKEAEELARQGEIIKAILKFNEISRDYPETQLKIKANGKAAELEKKLKEGEAEKVFLEAQALQRERKIIEATQLYQSIITRFSETPWAEKAQKEIDRFKDAQTRLQDVKIDEMREKSSSPKRMEEQQKFIGPFQEIDGLVLDMKKGDSKLESVIKINDEKKLAGYLWLSHKSEIEKIARLTGIPEEKEIKYGFSFVVARYLMGDKRALKIIPRLIEMGEGGEKGMREDFKPEGQPGFDDRESMPEDRYPRPEERGFEKIKEKAMSNKTVINYVEKRDMEGLRGYLMSSYFNEIKEISKELNRPFNDIATRLADMLIRDADLKKEPR